MGDACALVRGPFGGSLKKAIFKPSGFAVYEQQHAIGNQFEDFRYFVDQKKFEEMERFSVTPGDIIMSCSGTMGKVAKVPEAAPAGIINQALLKISPQDGLDPDFLMLWMESPGFQDQLSATTMGVAIKNVASVKTLKAMSLPLPPLEEQQRIVAVLDEAYEGLARARANAETNFHNARELFGSALQAALQDETVSWNDAELADLGDVVTGSTPKTSDKGNLGDHLPFVKPGDFLPDGSLIYDNQGLSEQGAAASRVLAGGSALMVCIGATIGKAGYTDRPIATNQQINAVVPKDGISGEYLYYQMLTPEFQADVMRQAGQATLPIINKGKWSKLKVRMPSDLSKQAGIVDKLSSIRAQVDAASTHYEAQILDLDDLRQSLLQKAFAGELT